MPGKTRAEKSAARIPPLIHPIPQPLTLVGFSSAYFAARFALFETLFWLGTLKMVAPRVHAGEAPLGWAAASTTIIFLTLTLPAWILVFRARLTPLAFLLAFASAIANMVAWKHGIALVR
jgi:hypothetical protein